MKVFLWLPLLLVILTACTSKDKNSSNPAVLPTNQAPDQLIQDLKTNGKKIKGTQTSLINRDYQVITTEEEEHYFVNGKKVVASSRQPEKRERKLMYWRNTFHGHLYREKAIQDSQASKSHMRPLVQLACDDLKMGVVYDPNRDSVIRVFYYANN